MIVFKEHCSPHFEDQEIPVEFVVLHYTAQSLEESLRIFTSGSKALSCHLLIDEKGKVYELVKCWEGTCYKAFHAGQSSFLDSQSRRWDSFNNFSLGIELVNWNGNIFNFTEDQYQSLFELLTHLKSIYPALQNPERIVGHEHITGFRGKKDPGALFDWEKLFQSLYKKIDKRGLDFIWDQNLVFQRSSVLTKKQCQSLAFLKNSRNWNDKTARQISLIMEQLFLPFWLKKILFWLVIAL